MNEASKLSCVGLDCHRNFSLASARDESGKVGDEFFALAATSIRGREKSGGIYCRMADSNQCRLLRLAAKRSVNGLDRYLPASFRAKLTLALEVSTSTTVVAGAPSSINAAAMNETLR